MSQNYNDLFDDFLNETEQEFETTENQQKKLYADFNYQREDREVRGKNIWGLDRIVEKLHENHSDSFFSLSNPRSDENLLDTIVRTCFPSNFPIHMYISNISLQDNYWQIMIRPVVGPLLEKKLPQGLSLAFIGGFNENHRGSPALTIRDIKLVANTPCLPFEREISCPVVAISELYEAKKQNILSAQWLGALPEISKKTKQQLKEWRDYLDFKSQVVQHQELGVRYLEHYVDIEEQQVEFIIAARKGDNSAQRMRRQNVSSFVSNCSTEAWQFKPNMDKHFKSRALGDSKEFKSLSAEEANKITPPKEDPQALVELPQMQMYRWRFNLSDDDKEKLDKQITRLRQQGLSDTDFAYELNDLQESWQDKFSQQGFLAISSAGERAQIQRHRKVLQQLEKQSGYNPMLSSFLFEINKAQMPKEPVTLDFESLLNKDLNDSQKQCVEKMLSVPDIGLLQGPPGTGKTTVIAELIYQLTRRGERVLLVSQAHLAVDNALERLPYDPNIRAVRLGPEDKISKGAKPFTKNKLLGRFYQSIANKVDSTFLSQWRELDEQVVNNKQAIQTLQGIYADCLQDVEKLTALATEYQSASGQHRDVKNLYEQAIKQQEYASHQQQQSQRLLTGLNAKSNNELSQHWARSVIPNNITDSWVEETLTLIATLRQNSLILGLPPLPQSHEDKATRLAYCQHFAQQAYSTLDRGEQVANDYETLSSAGGVKDTKLELEITRLEQEKAHQVTLISNGDNKAVVRLQEISKQISELQQQNKGLDRSFYQKLVEQNSILLSHNADLSEQITELKRLTKAVEQLKVEWPIRQQVLQIELERIINQSVAEPDKTALEKLESQRRGLQQQQQQWQEHLQKLSQRGHQLIGQFTEQNLPVVLPTSDNEQEVLQAIKLSLQKLQEQQDELFELAEQIQPQRQGLESVLKRWHQQLGSEGLGADHQHFGQEFIEHCNVVAITCNERERTLDDLSMVSFDTVVIDEVSKATPPELLMAIMRGRRVILVGDHRQLPPVFQERHDKSWEEAAAESEENEEPSLLTKNNLLKHQKMVSAALFKQHFEQADESLKTALYTQYRMHPQIMDLINVFYEGRLNCGLNNPDKERAHGLTVGRAEHRDLPFIRPNQHAYWIDSSLTPDGKPYFEQQAGTSKINPLEVELIVKSLKQLNNSMEEKQNKSASSDKNVAVVQKTVGVISFYGRQVRELRRAIQPIRKQLRYLDIDVNTVDRFQGKEEDVILVSMVRNTPSGRSGNGAYVAQFERINVALSRARELLLVFGAKDLFAGYQVELPYLDRPGKMKRAVYRDIINKLESQAALFSSKALLDPIKDKAVYERLRKDAEKASKGTQSKAKKRNRKSHSKLSPMSHGKKGSKA
ncbi:DEAD/DEAH box helicase [Vibrio rotiferianus]|uniref:DEAD/DEAH box helicase n=1 Tax=Vibrio rotiferianus TaxID=190895 RepID=UPI0038B23AD6